MFTTPTLKEIQNTQDGVCLSKLLMDKHKLFLTNSSKVQIKSIIFEEHKHLSTL